MNTKSEIIAIIFDEFLLAKNTTWTLPPNGRGAELRLPPQLWLGDGRSLEATDGLLDAVSQYTNIICANDLALKASFKVRELEALVQRALAQTLVDIDLDQPKVKICGEILENLENRVREEFSRGKQAIDLTLGCQLLVGDDIYPIKIGPVVFEERFRWVEQALTAGRISKITARRISSTWKGRHQRKRRSSHDSYNERIILDTVGNYPIVCSVSTQGLSSKVIQDKGILVARLAMSALSLAWQTPSKTLEWLNINYDGDNFRRHYVLFRCDGYAGSSSSRSGMPVGIDVLPGNVTRNE